MRGVTAASLFVRSSRPVSCDHFSRTFVTMRTLCAETRRAIPELRVELKWAGVAVFSPDGQDFWCLYLRAEVEAALGRTKDHKI